jgi:hypothetical protein
MLANSSMLVSLHEFLRSYHGVTLSKWVFQLQVYVVYMGKGLQGDSSDRQHGTRRLHYQMLAAVHDGRSVKKKSYHIHSLSVDITLACRGVISLTGYFVSLHSLEKAHASHVYTYSSGFQGFAAKLNKEQAMKLAGNFAAHGFTFKNMHVAL